MPLTVFDCKGISAIRRERIKAAVEVGGKHAGAGRLHRVSLIAFEGPEPQIGDWLVVHSGYALRRVDSEEAAAIVRELRAGQEALS